MDDLAREIEGREDLILDSFPRVKASVWLDDGENGVRLAEITRH